ncbi:MAG TPA: hypothetical protein VI997_11400 [Candidatus Thermoplasmatota archaeon]|nr:hypothetical protein [Candidatus Thermoplasmatota archaeon]
MGRAVTALFVVFLGALAPAASGGTTAVGPTALDVAAGGSVTFAFLLRNDAASERTFDVKFTVSEDDWEVEPVEYSNIHIGPGEEEQRSVTVLAYHDAAPGTEAVVTVTTKSCPAIAGSDTCFFQSVPENSEGSVSFTARVLAPPSGRLASVNTVLATPEATLAPGAATEVSLNAFLRIEGEGCPEFAGDGSAVVDLSVTGAPKWLNASLDPPSFGFPLRCGAQSRAGVLRLLAEPSAPQADVVLYIGARTTTTDAEGSQASADTGSFTVHVTGAPVEAAVAGPGCSGAGCGGPTGPWWADNRTQAVLGAVGLAGSSAAGLLAIARVRRRRRVLHGFLDRADTLYGTHKVDPTNGIAKLVALRLEVRDLYARGEFEDPQYFELEKRVTEYVMRLRVNVLERSFRLPGPLLLEARRLTGDGEVSDADLAYLDRLVRAAPIDELERDALLATIAQWALEDRRGRAREA